MRSLRQTARAARLAITALEATGRARLAKENAAARAVRLQEACADIAASHNLQLDVRGKLPGGPAILVANHVGYLDPIAIAAAVPCAPIAKSELAGWPMIGTAAAALGVIFVSRDSVASRVRVLRRAHVALRAGANVLNFPEGTTTDGTCVLPFRRGIFGLARLARVPVVPIAVRCSRDLSWCGNAPFVPHYLKVAASPSPSIRLDVGEPLEPMRYASAAELAAIAHFRIVALLGATPVAARLAA